MVECAVDKMSIIKDLLSNVTLEESNKPYVQDVLFRLSKKEFFEGVYTVYKALETSFEFCELEGLGLETSHSHRPVGIFLMRSSHLSAILLGCFKFGIPVMCLDPETIELNCKKLEESIKFKIVLIPAEDSKKIHQMLMKSNAFSLRKEFTLWELQFQIWVCEETAVEETTISPKYLYAVLTSGSTGEPKIVRVPESSILPNIFYLRSEWRITEDDVVLLSSPPTFDLFLLELLLALVSGAGMFIVPPDIAASPAHFLDLVFPIQLPPPITIAQFTPSVFRRWSSEEILTRVLTSTTSLKVLALGGETFPSATFWKCSQAEDNQTLLYSLYGTTELSCWAMIASGPYIENELGTPLSETLLQVQDNTGAVIQQGTGQLLIGSDSRVCLVGDEDCVYLKTPVFRATGDIVTLKDGIYRYIGRKDNIVKRWGHRLSLDQVERLATDCTDVSAACCILRGDKLVLFVSLKQEAQSLDWVKSKIRRLLLTHLKKASQPDIILQQETFPLTKHGKINRKKLVTILKETDGYDTKEDNPSEMLKSLWQDFTQDKRGEDDGFLSLGGSSVLAMQIVNKLSPIIKDLGSDLLSALLNNRSLSECCQVLEHERCRLKGEKMPSKRLNEGKNQSEKKKYMKNKTRSILMILMKSNNCNLKSIVSNLQLTISWTLNLSKCVDASPTIVAFTNGECHSLIGSHSGKLASIDIREGSLNWELQLPDRIESCLSISSCMGYGLIGCYDGHVYCVDVVFGSIIWSLRTGAMVKGIPFLIDDTWIFGSYDYYVYSVKVKTGDLLWRQKLGGPVLATPIRLSSISVIVASLRGEVAALQTSDSCQMWLTQLDSPVYSSPCIVTNLLIVAEVAGVLHALKPESGDKVWQYQAGGQIFSSLTSVENRVMFGCHDNQVYCLKVSDGELVWRLDLGSVVYATPFCLSSTHIIAASQSGFVYVIEITGGTTCCSLKLPGQVFSSPVAFQNYIVIGSRDDNVYCLNINTNFDTK